MTELRDLTNLEEGLRDLTKETLDWQEIFVFERGLEI